jgi:uncharacterized protein with FMN-binding domain
MRRAFSTLAATALGVVWLVTFKVTPVDIAAVPSQAARTAPPATPSATASRTPTPTSRLATPLPTSALTPANSGTFSGTTIETLYGPVQVRIVVSGQKVIDVQALQLPRDRARSAFISQYSAPLLRTEAIQAQNAVIDIISGATYTSIAYGRSLDSALKQAHLG